MEKMVKMFNELMEGFKDEVFTVTSLLSKPEGELRSRYGNCRYKLIHREGNYVLGAYGFSRFTNSTFYEIGENGEIIYEWLCQEFHIANNKESEEAMYKHNRLGNERMREFGLGDD